MASSAKTANRLYRLKNRRDAQRFLAAGALHFYIGLASREKKREREEGREILNENSFRLGEFLDAAVPVYPRWKML